MKKISLKQSTMTCQRALLDDFDYEEGLKECAYYSSLRRRIETLIFTRSDVQKKP